MKKPLRPSSRTLRWLTAGAIACTSVLAFRDSATKIENRSRSKPRIEQASIHSENTTARLELTPQPAARRPDLENQAAPETEPPAAQPAAPLATATVSPESNLPIPPGAVRDSLVLHFSNYEEMLNFLELAKARGYAILGILGELRTVRIGLRGDSQDQEIFSFAERHSQPVFDYPVFPPTPLPAEGAPGEVPFGGTALEWLGVPETNADWGSGVTVAVLDSALAADALPDANIERISLHPPGAETDTRHGTAVSSLLVSNDPQAPGIAPAARLVHVDVLGTGSQGTTFAVAQGILEALDRGANVISMSLGTATDSRVLREAIQFATEQGAVIVAAAGNDSLQRVSYPAAYDSVVAVTSVDAEGRRAQFANSGPEVDIAAPGVGLRAAASAGGTITISGTSVSTPLISGMIAQVLSQDKSLSARDAAEIVLQYANDLGPPGIDSIFGSGVLNADRIQNRAVSGVFDAAITDHWVVEDVRGNAELVVGVQNRGTEVLRSVQLIVRAGNISRTFGMGSIEPNHVVSGRVPLDRRAASGQPGIEIETLVEVGSDDNLSNNSKSFFLHYPSPG